MRGGKVSYYCAAERDGVLTDIRAAKGLAPLLETSEQATEGNQPTPVSAKEQPASKKNQPQSLSFSSGGSGGKRGNVKRKAVGDVDDESAGEGKPSASTKKKPKKAQKKLLSFGDEA